MGILYTIYYCILKIGTQIRLWFKPQSNKHFISKALVIGSNFDAYDITSLINKHKFTGKMYKKLSLPLSLNPRILDIEYQFNNSKYNVLYEVETITDNKQLFPLYSLNDDTLNPPSNLLSVTINNEDITDIIKKYEGPYTDFHNEATKNVDFSTLLRLNQKNYSHDHKIEIMTSALEIKIQLLQDSIRDLSSPERNRI